MDLTHEQAEVLERLQSRGFRLVSFPMFANYVGVRKGHCVALLAPLEKGTFKIFGTPTCMVGENPGARVSHKDGEWFVWKKDRLEATPELVSDLERFSAELADALLPTS